MVNKILISPIPVYLQVFLAKLKIFRCDRILSYGKGMRLLNYRRNEIKMSDHRPVTATYMAEVEVFSPRKLQRALTLTDAEIENEDVVAEMGINAGIGSFRLEQVNPLSCL